MNVRYLDESNHVTFAEVRMKPPVTAPPAEVQFAQRLAANDKKDRCVLVVVVEMVVVVVRAGGGGGSDGGGGGGGSGGSCS